jgi:hypothetical protein
VDGPQGADAVGERAMTMQHRTETLVAHSPEEWNDPNRPTPHLVTNPADDVEFRRFAEACLAAGVTPDALEATLRLRHPSAVVHARVLSGERQSVWYVYREGHWVARRRNHPSDEPR